MPWRPLNREQAWLLPPSVEELVADDHPARMVAAFVDQLSDEEWSELGVALEGQRLGSPAYHPRALLSVWLYGFMSGLRSSRSLEQACREQLPYLYLTAGQRPDHNTLWRFYERHRTRMRRLLRLTVETAVRLELVDWALQAVDGTKIAGAAANRRTLSEPQLARLQERTEAAIAELESQQAGEPEGPPRLGRALRDRQRLQQQVEQARAQIERTGQRWVNLSDPEARLMRGPQGRSLTGYNAQAMAARLKPEREDGAGGTLLLAAEVTQEPGDAAQLLPMVEAADALSQARLTVADAGYFASGAVERCQQLGVSVAVPEAKPDEDHPYHWRRFRYEPERDRYRCPQGQVLERRQRRLNRRTPAKLYQAEAEACRGCPAFGVCTSARSGRTITISDAAEALERHRVWMRSAAAREALRRRPGLIEPVFGQIKERLAGRRFLLRGLEAVAAEWSLLAVAFNLKALAKYRARALTRAAPAAP